MTNVRGLPTTKLNLGRNRKPEIFRITVADPEKQELQKQTKIWKVLWLDIFFPY